jgi:non-specific protein-tyrosine kinase
MQELLESLKQKADIVVIDSPPVTVISDAVVLATRVDGLLIVFRSGKTRLENARNALNALKQVHARVLGVVLNGTGSRTQDYYYRYRTDYGVQAKHGEARKKDGFGSGPTGAPKPSNPPAAD